MEHDSILERHKNRFEAHQGWMKSALKQHGSNEILSCTTPNSPYCNPSCGPRTHTSSALCTPARSEVTHQQHSPVQLQSQPAPYSFEQRQRQTVAAVEWIDDNIQYPHHQGDSTSPSRHGNVEQTDEERYGLDVTVENEEYGDMREIEGVDEQYYYNDQQEGRVVSPPGSHPDTVMLMTGDALNVHSRSALWMRRKNQKIDEKRRYFENKQLQNCTFKPDVQSRKVSNRVNDSTAVDRSSVSNNSPNNNSNTDVSIYRYRDEKDSSSVSGWDAFMQRQLRAKEILREKEIRGRFCSGEGWKRENTVVEEFNLGSKKRLVNVHKKLKNVLKPPVPAPCDALNSSESLSPIRSSASVMLPCGVCVSEGLLPSYRNRNIDSSLSDDRIPTSDIDKACHLPPKGLFSLRGSSAVVGRAHAERQ
eukprot:Tbor_TRINITY_DN4302_c0_g1::TRINITY_DN4302_c0_g1_i1::g.7793::m.7793